MPHGKKISVLIFHPNRFDVVDGVPIILHGMNRILGIATHCTFPHHHLAHCAIQHNVGFMLHIDARIKIWQRKVSLFLQAERLCFVCMTIFGAGHLDV